MKCGENASHPLRRLPTGVTTARTRVCTPNVTPPVIDPPRVSSYIFDSADARRQRNSGHRISIVFVITQHTPQTW